MGLQFWYKIRRRHYGGAVYEGRYPLPASRPSQSSAPPATPRTTALVQRYRIHRLIDRGLLQFSDRLGAAEWRQVQAELQILDPSLRGLTLHIDELILATRRVAMENGGSDGVANLTEAAAFQTWANDLVEALEQYRRDCEAVIA